MKQNNLPENILNEALKSLDNGKSTSEVLKVYSQYRLELSEIIKIIKLLRIEKERIIPKPNTLNKILMDLNFGASVTKQEVSRYLDRGKESFASIDKPASLIYNQIMNWKIFLPIGVVIVIVIIFMGVSGGKPSLPQPVPTISESETQEISTGSPTLDNELNSIIEAAASGDDLSEPVADFGGVEKDLDLISI